jgi:hypothetical protein
VILGAGASHDVWNGKTPRLHPEWRPPLAKHLFDARENENYMPLLRRYEGAAFIADLIAPLVDRPGTSFEQELSNIANHTNSEMRTRFNFVPPYIRDVIHRSGTDYVESPSTYIRLVTKLLWDYDLQVLFLTLNYDDLLEKALEKLDSSFSFNRMGDYIHTNRQALVVKLHGSVDWFVKMSGGTGPDVEHWDSQVRAIDPREVVRRKETQVVHGVSSVRSAAEFLYPVLTAPLVAKGADAYSCPPSHIDLAEEFLKDCKKFLIIGTSGRDEDVHQLLNRTVPNGRFQWLAFVGREDVVQAFTDFQTGAPAFELSQHIGNNPTYSDGFRSYAYSDELDEFADRRG